MGQVPGRKCRDRPHVADALGLLLMAQSCCFAMQLEALWFSTSVQTSCLGGEASVPLHHMLNIMPLTS